MSVPETAVHEDYGAEPRQHDVRLAWQPGHVQTVPKAPRVERLPNHQFRARVSPPDSSHHPAARPSVDDVSQSIFAPNYTTCRLDRRAKLGLSTAGRVSMGVRLFRYYGKIRPVEAPYTDAQFRQLRRRAGLTVSETAMETGYSERTISRWDRGETSPRRAAVDRLRSRIRHRIPVYPDFTFIDLFAGIGGLRQGFEAIGGECIFSSEWNRFCQTTYEANYGTHHVFAGDITKLESDDIPPHDVLLAGFPCQPFSLAGVSKKNALNQPHGFRCETQGTLFFDVARILAQRRPSIFLLENVKNLVNHDRGRTFRVIMDTLEKDLGYRVHVRVLNARSWVPQHRERIFIAGFLDDTGFSFDSMEVPDPSAGPRLESILHPEDGSEVAEPGYTEGRLAKVNPRYTLSQHLWEYLQAYAAKHRRKGNGFGFGLFGPDDVARTLSARYFKDGSEILIRQSANRCPRRLTPRECARLMGFDRPGSEPFRIPVSNTQAYRQFGNAVVVPVVEAVARHMGPCITAARSHPLLDAGVRLAASPAPTASASHGPD